MPFGLCSILMAGLLALGPLSDERSAQVATARDNAHPDQPALYALLAEALEQEGPASDIGATVVDDRVLLTEPQRWRGQAVVVEGHYAGRQRRIGLQRAGGPWGDAVTEWGIAVRDPLSNPQDAGIVMVWLADPSETIEPPRHDASVRIVGRFLNIWQDVDADGNSVRYPVIVARSADVLPAADRKPVATGQGLGFILLLMLAMLYVVWRLRRWASAGRADWRQARRERLRQERALRNAATGDADVMADSPQPPRDAAEALREMSQTPRTE